MSSNN